MKPFFAIFFPVLVNFICGKLIQQTDLVMIASLADPSATAAFGIPSSIMFIDMMIAFALAPVVSVHVARYEDGNARARELSRIISLISLIAVAAAGIGLYVYPLIVPTITNDANTIHYANQAIFWLTLSIPFRMSQFAMGMAAHGIGKGRQMAIYSLAGIPINAGLNWVLMIKGGWGFEGVLAATFVSSVISCFWMLLLLRRDLHLKTLLSFPDLPWTQEFLKPTTAEFSRLASERLSAYIILSLFGIGSHSVAKLASFAVISEFLFLISSPLVATMRSVAILVSKMRDADGTREAVRKFIFVCGFWAGCSSLSAGFVIYLFNGAIGQGMYGLQETALTWWHTFCLVLILLLPLMSLSCVLKGVLQAMNQFGSVARIDIVSTWLFTIPIMFIGNYLQSPLLTWSGYVFSTAAVLLQATMALKEDAVADTAVFISRVQPAKRT